MLLSESTSDAVGLSRIENIHKKVKTYFCSFQTRQSSEVFAKRDKILYLLDDTDPMGWDEAESLIGELEHRAGFELPFELQFVFGCKARLNELKLLDPHDTLRLVNEGMALTCDEFIEQGYSGDKLIFEEVTLVHMMACAYKRMGKASVAIKLLCDIHEGISKLPEDDHEKEQKLAPVLLSLADFYIQEGDYKEALDVCWKGNTASTKRNKGKYTPNFLYNMALCYHKLDRVAECRWFLQLSYIGYILMWKKEAAEVVMAYAIDCLGEGFNTYGVENLLFRKYDPIVAHGERVACGRLGELIAFMRVSAKMTQEKLSEGVCNQSSLNRMESNKTMLNVYSLEVFMQRLGRDINKYFSTFPSVEDFNDKQTRDEINVNIVNLKFDKAEKLLEVLKGKKAYKKRNIGQQFIKEAEATIFASKKGYDKPEYLAMLMEALKITIPDFDEKEVDKYNLAYAEITIINQMAIHYCEAGDTRRGVKLFERLIDSLNDSYVDEHEKVRTYITVLYNYSKYLGIMKRYDEALEIVDEGEMLSISHGAFTLLPSFAINRACNLLDLGKKEESVPYFAMAFYGTVTLDEKNNYLKIIDYVKEHLGITFDYLGLGSQIFDGDTPT